MTKRMKVRELREKYDKEDIEIEETLTPRSNKQLHGFRDTKKQTMKRYAAGEIEKDSRGQLSPKHYKDEEVVWELPLDRKVNALTDSKGDTSILVKNIKVEVWET
jgi:hypothetical protein